MRNQSFMFCLVLLCIFFCNTNTQLIANPEEIYGNQSQNQGNYSYTSISNSTIIKYEAHNMIERFYSPGKWATQLITFNPSISEDFSVDFENEESFECSRGSICTIPINSIANNTSPMIGSSFRVVSRSFGIVFNVSEDRTKIIGIPLRQGKLFFILEYADSTGNLMRIGFHVIVPKYVEPNHIFMIHLIKPTVLDCKTSSAPCVQLLTNLAEYLGGPASSLSLDQVKKEKNGRTTVLFHNSSLSLTKCRHTNIDKLTEKMYTDGDINRDFINHLKPHYEIEKFTIKKLGICEKPIMTGTSFYPMSLKTDVPTPFFYTCFAFVFICLWKIVSHYIKRCLDRYVWPEVSTNCEQKRTELEQIEEEKNDDVQEIVEISESSNDQQLETNDSNSI